jgi:oleandomycin transport system ATP-binding protein
MSYAIEAHGLTKSFGDTHALIDVDLFAREATVLGVLGPNGAGKTTAVRILATLLQADAGTAMVAGHDLRRDPQAVRRAIGLTGQYASVDEMLTGRENLELFARLQGMRASSAKARAAELLGDFGLDEAADRRAKTYSGGMRRRLDLAASLVNRPALIFLDEPTTGLDPSKRDDVWGIVHRLTASGTSVLLTTQYLEEAEALADDITVIDRGRVIATGTPSELKQIVGSQTLRVRPADAANIARVARILTDVTGRGADVEQAEVASVPATDEHLAAVVGALAANGIQVTELSLTLPSLDEVFFALTGHNTVVDASDSAPEPEEAHA